MIVVGNGATPSTLLKARFVIFSCQKYVKKGYVEMAKKIYLEPLKKCAGTLHFPLLLLWCLNEDNSVSLVFVSTKSKSSLDKISKCGYF